MQLTASPLTVDALGIAQDSILCVGLGQRRQPQLANPGGRLGYQMLRALDRHADAIRTALKQPSRRPGGLIRTHVPDMSPEHHRLD
jgi:hypothetical protein